MSRADFIDELGRFRVLPFQYSGRDVADESSDAS